mmetsp:Transcript_55502/g.173638  ORF Transcript_55502/g.173638 Transcript_55502/m.173638 type:complete len:356 (+) Transcript_55502:182-1249(+)
MAALGMLQYWSRWKRAEAEAEAEAKRLEDSPPPRPSMVRIVDVGLDMVSPAGGLHGARFRAVLQVELERQRERQNYVLGITALSSQGVTGGRGQRPESCLLAVVFDSSTHLTVFGLKPDTLYEFDVHAEGFTGASAGIQVHLQTPPPPPQKGRSSANPPDASGDLLRSTSRNPDLLAAALDCVSVAVSAAALPQAPAPPTLPATPASAVPAVGSSATAGQPAPEASPVRQRGSLAALGASLALREKLGGQGADAREASPEGRRGNSPGAAPEFSTAGRRGPAAGERDEVPFFDAVEAGQDLEAASERLSEAEEAMDSTALGLACPEPEQGPGVATPPLAGVSHPPNKQAARPFNC